MMHKGFSLLEVIIAVTIISLFATAILQISQNSIKYVETNDKRILDTALISIQLDDELIQVQKDEFFLNEILEKRYNLSDDDLLYFKDKKIAFQVDTKEELHILEKESDMKMVDLSLPVILKIDIHDQQNGSFIYRLMSDSK